MTIHVLDEQTINKIAAGEVIERPASALKELLENSADSGATKVEIDFDQGGKKYLKVSDNGSGIDFKDLHLAVERHATSKITTSDDLDKLTTFGFRGEALSSLAAVSRFSLHSTLNKSSDGGKISVEGGKTKGAAPAAPIEGTTVVAEDLFFNVPARQKFLKSDGAETGAVKRVVKSFALSHPETSIIVRQNQKVLFHWPAQDFSKRACQILDLPEKDVISILVEDHGMKLKAILGNPERSVSTQQGIWIFVQGRPVTDRTLQFAIQEGYRNLLMHHQYPQVVLWLSLDPQTVDVNVHPSKAQVKFLDPSSIFRFVSRNIRDAFEKSLPRVTTSFLEVAASTHYVEMSKPSYQPQLVQDAVIQYNTRSMGPVPLPTTSPMSQPEEKLHKDEKPAGAWGGLQLIGQFSHTYLVCQGGTGLVLIDQHAAHERVLFERLKVQAETGLVEKQMSLIEDLLEMESEVVETLLSPKSLDFFGKAGFEFYRRGPTTLAVAARPAFLIDIPLKPLFERMAEQMGEVHDATALRDFQGEIWASMACHGAIRAGRVLAIEEMRTLLSQMDEFAFSSFCPHGRPVSVKMGLTEIEKLFKRIV